MTTKKDKEEIKKALVRAITSARKVIALESSMTGKNGIVVNCGGDGMGGPCSPQCKAHAAMAELRAALKHIDELRKLHTGGKVERPTRTRT
jgi:hypothetical protein